MTHPHASSVANISEQLAKLKEGWQGGLRAQFFCKANGVAGVAGEEEAKQDAQVNLVMHVTDKECCVHPHKHHDECGYCVAPR